MGKGANIEDPVGRIVPTKYEVLCTVRSKPLRADGVQRVQGAPKVLFRKMYVLLVLTYKATSG